jgi:hypothetical protein
MNTKDRRVIRAMGSHFEQLRQLAEEARDPNKRPEVEQKIGAILETMNRMDRAELRAALLAAGWPRRS